MNRQKLKEMHENPTGGDILSNIVTGFVGSWWFIVFQTIVIGAWTYINLYHLENPVDPYPFVFLNLLIAVETAYISPLIMMSQKNQEKKDRLRDDLDFEADIESNRNIEEIKGEITELKLEIERLRKSLGKTL